MDTVDIEVRVMHKTSSAVLVNDGDIEVWIPLSCLEKDVDLRTGGKTMVTISERLAADKGLV